MARFMASMQGKAGSASRLGSINSGITTHTRGWNLGVRVQGRVVADKDEFTVHATGGSTDPTATRFILRVFETQEGDIRVEYNGHAYEIFDGELRPLVVGIH